jgi:hypothetical protein
MLYYVATCRTTATTHRQLGSLEVRVAQADAKVEHNLKASVREITAQVRGLGSSLPRLHGDWARPCHICTWTGLGPATSAPGPGSSLPHLGLGSPLAKSAPGLLAACGRQRRRAAERGSELSGMPGAHADRRMLRHVVLRLACCDMLYYDSYVATCCTTTRMLHYASGAHELSGAPMPSPLNSTTRPPPPTRAVLTSCIRGSPLCVRYWQRGGGARSRRFQLQ